MGTNKTSIVKVETKTGKRCTIRGRKSLSNKEYYFIEYEGRSGLVARQLMAKSKSAARDKLIEQNVMITSDADWRRITEAIEDVRRFARKPLIDQPGWCGEFYADVSGLVIGPSNAKQATAVFPPLGEGSRLAGTHDQWLDKIARPLTGQHLPMLAVLAGLASCLVRFFLPLNPGFELSGPPQRGKSTLLALMTATAMSPDEMSNFNTTQAGLESLFPLRSDMPFAVDETRLMSDRQALEDFSFRMAQGTVKLTQRAGDRALYRFIFMTSSNRDLASRLGSVNADSASASLQRHIPLKVREDELGVFDFVPEGFGSSGDFADYLQRMMREQFGTAHRKLVVELVKTRHKDPDRFEKRMRKWMKQFCSAVGMDATAAGKSRVTDAFGLLYAVGRYARARKILPREWDSLQACLAGYRNYEQQLPGETHLASRLKAIVSRTETVDLRGHSELPQISDKDLKKASAFLYEGIGGRVELLVTPDARKKWFPDWTELSRRPEFARFKLGTKGRKDVQRQIGRNRKKERFVAFSLPSELVPPVRR